MILRWLPWRWVVKRAARTYGLLDPLTVLARIRQFAEPSEVHEPLEIVRAWIVFHSRGIINTRAIQHNLDWVWPWWVERQFNPRDPSFIPRAYSISHINMTHRDWTAVGLPGIPVFPLVDPRGMVTPLYDGWSIDFWVLGKEQGMRLTPSKTEEATQKLECGPEHRVITHLEQNGMCLDSVAEMEWAGEHPVLKIQAECRAPEGSHLVVGLRPYNSEGIQFIDHVAPLPGSNGWIVNDKTQVCFDQLPERFLSSNYGEGDVSNLLRSTEERIEVRCDAGMATAAALFPVKADGRATVEVRIDLSAELDDARRRGAYKRGTPVRMSWKEYDAKTARLELPDQRLKDLFTQSARTVLLLSPEEVYPGPYVYRRFWYRDAAFMLAGLLALNHAEPCRTVIEEVFPRRHKRSGFFESQEGEWDSNGEVLWIAERYVSHSGRTLSQSFMDRLRAGALWIRDKRTPFRDGQPYPGLLPPGFSAEHLGPNNYYYWDNFWGIAGLRAGATLFRNAGDTLTAEECERVAKEFDERVWETINAIPERRAQGAIPAAPNRRLDAGAIGSIVADYPLQLTEPGNSRILKTIEFLMDKCLVRGGFFQDMTHSGINPYLTLHLAQILLRAGDSRWYSLIESVAALASPTGQWPEAVHPSARGGCMGDGQHGWAAAEMVLMMRALFLREEGDTLVIGPGLRREWLDSGADLSFGPTLTAFGELTIRVVGPGGGRELCIDGTWRKRPARIHVHVPGYPQSEWSDPSCPHKLIRE